MKTNYYVATLFLVAGGVGLGTYLVPRGGELAMIYYRSGRLDEARQLLEREMHSGDVTPSNVHFATQTYLRLGDIDRAIALVERYVEAHPDDVRARRILGGFYNDAGKRSLYLVNLEEIERLAPAQAQRIELASLYRATGDDDKWAAILTRLVAENAAAPSDYLDLAQIEAAAGKRDRAFAVLDALEKHHLRNLTMMAYELRISMELDERRPERALAWAKAGVARLPDVGTALGFVSLFQRRGRPELALAVLEPFGDRVDADMVLVRALVALEIANGKAARALARLLALERAAKLSGTDRNYLIVAAVIAGQWDAAKTAFEATEFDDVSEEALDRVAREGIARGDRGAIRMILSRASPQFLDTNPIIAGQLSLLLEDRAGATRWADKAYANKDMPGAERIELAKLYVGLDNLDRARALIKSLAADPAQIRDNAVELAELYLKLDMAADGFALMDRAAKADDDRRLRAARALLDAKLRPEAGDRDLAWAGLGAGAPARAADLVTATYWAAMNSQLHAFAATLGRRLFEAAPTNESRLRYARALALAGDAKQASEIVRPLLAESADARGIYSLALIAAVKAGTARADEVKDFIAKQLADPALSLADKKSLISELIEAKAYGVVLPLLEEQMRLGRSEYVESYIWALTAVRDKKQLRALLQRELQQGGDRRKMLALATVAFQESMFDLARPAFLKILKEDPKNLDALKRLGQMASWSGDPDGGRRYLEAFVAAGGDDYHADYALAEAIIVFPDWQRATPHYQRALAKIARIAKPTLEDQMLRAKILYRLARFDDSIAAYEALLRRYPRDRALRDDYFDVLSEMGRYDRARQLRGGRAVP